MKIVRLQHPDFPLACYGRILDEYPERVEILDQAPWHKPHQISTAAVPLSAAKLLAPCQPTKIIGVGKNYSDHAQEMAGITGDGSVPEQPLIFFKPPSAVIGPEEAILLPEVSQQVDFEGELAVVIGRSGYGLTAATALEYIAGFTIANDVTARDLQRRDPQWTRAKGFDTFCPLGPWLVSALSPSARLETVLNDQIQQSATLDQMVFSYATLVAYISQIMTLLPGDVVLTGTPSGVGALSPGDRVTVRIEGIGTLENPVIKSNPEAKKDPRGTEVKRS